MKTLQPRPLGRMTTVRALQKLQAHYSTIPLHRGHVLYHLAILLPDLGSDDEIIFLTERNAPWLEQVLIIKDGEVHRQLNPQVVDYDWDGSKYRAVFLSGVTANWYPRRTYTKEELVEALDLQNTMKRLEKVYKRTINQEPEDDEDN